MIISNNGLEFITGWEKFRNKAYRDEAGIWTIGYGTTRYFDGELIKKGDTISFEDAKSYLIHELDGIAIKISHWISSIILYIPESDALASLVYNIGTYAFRSSTLLKEINARRKIQEDYFTRWNKIHKDGKLISSPGLTRRRKSEFKLFSEGDYKGNT